VDARLGELIWPVPADAAEGSRSVTVRVTDGGEPSLFAERTFTLRVVSTVTLGGKVRFHANPLLMVPGVRVAVAGGVTRTAATPVTGDFSFDLDVGGDYDLTATKLEEIPGAQGVSTLDITLIRRHLLGISALDSPYKLLAADVNRSDSVSTLDITLIRRLILGLTNNFPSGAWRFVPSNGFFPNPDAPWGFEAARKHRGLGAASSTEDFIGIRMGDVNGSWTPSVPPPPVPAFGPGEPPVGDVDKPAVEATLDSAAGSSVGAPWLSVAMQPQRARLAAGGFVQAGADEFELPVTVSGISKLGGIQFALQWNPEVLEFVRVAGTELPRFDETCFNAAEALRGVFRLAWTDPLGLDFTIAKPTHPMPVVRLVCRARTAAPAVSALRFLRKGPTAVELSADLALLTTDLVEGPVWLGRGPEQARLEVLMLRSGEVVLQVPTWHGAGSVVETISDLSRPDWQVLGTFKGDGTAVRVPMVPIPASGPTRAYSRLRFEF